MPSRPAARSGSTLASECADPARCRSPLAGIRESAFGSCSSVSARITSACARTPAGILGSSKGSTRVWAAGRSPASVRKPAPAKVRRTRAVSSSGGVSRSASAESIAAASGAPRSAAAYAARSTTSAIASSGANVASARCRASCSRSSTRAAACRWTSRRRPEGIPKYTARSQQRMREAHHAVRVDDDRSGRHGVVHESLDVGLPKRLREQGRGGALDRRDDLEQGPRVLGKRSDPFADQLLQRRRHR